MRYRFCFLLSLLLLWGIAPAQAQTNEIIRLVNEVRTTQGLPPFQSNNTLALAAQNQANWMATTGVYSHTQDNGSTPQTRAEAAGYVGYVSENIVGGTNLTPQQGVIWWQNSPIHLNTILSQRYVQIGAGFASGHGQNFYVIVVGRPSDTPPDPRDNPIIAPPPAMVAPIVISAPNKDGSIVHTVQDGQTFWAIAARYEIKLTDLFLFNSLSENDVLQPGTQLTIRLADGQAPPPTPTPPATHVVREGESVWTIAVYYDVSVADILWLNNLVETAVLQPGDEIMVRLSEGQLPPPTPTPKMAHIVQTGDSMWAIAAQHELTIEQLLAFNDLTESAVLQPGDALWIRPSPSSTPLPTVAETSMPTVTPETTVVAQLSTSLPPTITATAQSTPLASPELSPRPLSNSTENPLLMITLAIAAGLVLLAGATIFFMRRAI